MKKLISCLLAVMMLVTAVSAFAESSGLGRFGNSGIVSRFLKETDTKTKDIALQSQSGNESTDLVIRVDGDNLHLVSRTNAVEDGHVQLNPTGIYVVSDGTVKLLRYATVTTVVKDIAKELNSMLELAIESIPEEALPTQREINKAVSEMSIVATAVEAQEQADAVTLSTAAMAFADKFKPEYILDIKESDGSVQIELRSEAFATALAEALDEMMSNPMLAELVDREAALTGGKSFASFQKDWLKNREAALEAVRTIKSTDAIDEDGHWVSHFQIGEESQESAVLMSDTDAWIDVENGAAQIAVGIGFKDEDPFMVYELAVDRYAYREKLTSGNSMTEVQMNFEDAQVVSGKAVTVIEDNEAMRMEFGPDYVYMRSPKGAISTTVRETWTGKIRYEMIAETAEGKEASVIADFYEDGDSLVCEVNSSKSDLPAIFKLSRIDKIDIADLRTAENINEITVDQIKAELGSLLKAIVKTSK